MHSPSKPEEEAKTTRSSAFEVALGLALAGAVCGLVALSQSASAGAAANDAPLASAGSSFGGSTGSAGAGQGGAMPKSSDSMEVALLLRQRTSANLLVEDAR